MARWICFLLVILMIPVIPAQAQTLRWVDFDVPYESLKYALEQDIATFEEEKHLPWIERMQKKYGVVAEADKAEAIVKREVGEIFSQVLEDAGVYKNTPEGITAFDRFMLTAGCLRK